jgi:hypothetical protein
MDSMLSSTQADPHHNVGVVPPAPKNPTAEEALCKATHNAPLKALDQRPRMARSDFSPQLRAVTADPSNDAFPRPSLGRGASRSLGRFLTAACAGFLMTACIGVAAELLWQSHGGVAKQLIATWVRQLGVAASLAAAPTAPDTIAATASAAPSAELQQPTAPAATSELQQLKTNVHDLQLKVTAYDLQLKKMRHDLAAMRESVEQRAAGQEQMAREIAYLQTAVNRRSKKTTYDRRPISPWDYDGVWW